MKETLINFEVLEEEVKKCENSETDERQELFNELILSNVISVAALSKRGITPELLLDIAHNNELCYDALEESVNIYDEFKNSIVNYYNRRCKKRRLF